MFLSGKTKLASQLKVAPKKKKKKPNYYYHIEGIHYSHISGLQ